MWIALDARLIHKNFSGIGHYSLNLLKALARIDRENQYLVIVRKGFAEELPGTFKIIEYDRYPFGWDTLYGLAGKLKHLRIDLFHSPFHICPLNLRCPVVLTVHDVTPLVIPDFFQGRNPLVRLYARHFTPFYLKKSIARAARIVSVSQYSKSDIVRLGLANDKKVSVIHPAIADSFTSQIQGNHSVARRDTGPVVLCVGQARPQKNWGKLLRAFKILSERLGKGRLVFVYSDNRGLEDLMTLQAELELNSDSVEYLGYQSNDSLRQIYRESDLFVFPSLYEGFGFPPLEAMACGVPVVASNRASLPEVLGDAALYVNPEDEKDIARGMQTALKDAKLREALVEKGLQQVKKYSWEKAARQVVELYHQVYRESKN